MILMEVNDISSKKELYTRLLRPIIAPYLAYKWFKNLPEKEEDL